MESLRFRLSKKGCRGRERRQVGVGGTAALRFARTRANRSFQGQTDENESRTLRTEMRMQTATFRSLVRIVPACALSSPVPAKPSLRIAAVRWLANVAKSRRNWFARMVAGRGPVGEQVELLLLDAVLHFAARAVQFLVENPRPRPLATQGSHDEAGVEAARTRQPFRLRDHPPRPAPRRSGPVTEVAEPPRRSAGRDAAAARLAQLPADALRQAGVAGQAEQVVDPIVFAPRHEIVAAKAAVAANDDFGLRPALANALHNPRQLLRRARRRVDVRRPQPRTQNQVVPHDVERKVAVRVVVAVEVTPLLVAMHRVVGGVDVQKDLLRRRRTSVEGQVDLEIVHRSRDGRDLLVPVRLGLAGHAQLEPVHGARTGQRNAAVALPNPLLTGQVGAPDSQRRTLSARSWSWSLTSS